VGLPKVMASPGSFPNQLGSLWLRRPIVRLMTQHSLDQLHAHGTVPHSAQHLMIA
jgi:hypothetical protein